MGRKPGVPLQEIAPVASTPSTQLSELDQHLTQQIANKKIEISNLEAQIRPLEIKKENLERMNETVMQRTLNEKLLAVSARESQLITRELQQTINETAYKNRLADLEKTEQEYVNFDKERQAFQQVRRDFIDYKNGVLRELGQAQITIEEAKVVKDALKQTEENLSIRERNIKVKEMEMDNIIYSLQQDRKAFEVEKANWEAVHAQEGEPVNV